MTSPVVPVDQQIVIVIEELESILLVGNQREFLAQQFIWQIELFDLQALAAPGITVHAETRRRNTFRGGIVSITSRKKTADDGKGVGRYDDIKAQIIDGFANDRAGLDNADLGSRR